MKAARGSGETEGCRFPNNTPLTSYGKGCRCKKCRSAFTQCVQKSKKKRYVPVNKGILRERKQTCADCGWNKIPSVLEFHHTVVDSSNTSISRAVATRTTRRFLQELDKGVFLCPTCHTCRHYDPVLDRVDLTNPGLR